ncbi:MAG: hypothetical protein ABF785_00625 [Acetobacter papayae]|uniref:hypothetical protein n=1 Tax=Acetobacter papayae TaxID=1076592 RepID=UPI0039EB1289
MSSDTHDAGSEDMYGSPFSIHKTKNSRNKNINSDSKCVFKIIRLTPALEAESGMYAIYPIPD